MNINSTVELSFDLAEAVTTKTVSAKQRDDKTRSVTVKLTLDGKPFIAPSDAEIRLLGTKPDSTVFELLPEPSKTSSEGSYTFVLTDFALSTVGNIRCEVRCSRKNGSNISICSTEVFYINNIASAMNPEDATVKAEIQSLEKATEEAKNVANSLSELAESLIEARDKGEFNGTKPVRGVDYWTEEDKEEIVGELSNLASSRKIPDYWEEHLAQKIEQIKAYQSESGKDAFSFIVMTDMHYESNLGKLSPTLAKRIMDECGIKFALCLGDTQTRHGARHDEAYIEKEWKDIEKMLSPIRDRLLITQGNHDGSYYMIDTNGDGVAEDANGDGISDEADRTVRNLTPEKIYEHIFRKVSTIDNVKFSSDGRGYYVDDTASKVRYILLNTLVNKYELHQNGTAKYNNMRNFRFGQAQYDMVVEALGTIPADGWSVIIASHVPLDRSSEYVYWGGAVDENGAQTGSPADCVIMQRLLNAYKKKTSYSGHFIGTEGDVASYVNYADSKNSDWAENSRLNSSNTVVSFDGRCVTNYIPCKAGDTIRLENLTFPSDAANDRMVFYDADKNILGGTSPSTAITWGAITADENGSYNTYVNVGATSPTGSTIEAYVNMAYVRLTLIPSDGNPIITVNEEITASDNKFDDVTVNADFEDAKGDLIGYFGGHVHIDNALPPSYNWNGAEHSDFYIITTRCDGRTENTAALINERVAGTITEQSFDVFTVDRKKRRLYATKIGAGTDRTISYV